ncbi:mannitol dehydrogenase family protein [Stenotrophomonas tumulicola]
MSMPSTLDRPRLSDATLDSARIGVRRPGYQRDATRIGIVHLGAGAFHRAHQAVYVDGLLAGEPGWAICAVSLHSPATADALAPQDGLYTLALLDAEPEQRVIGSIREVLFAGTQQDAVLARLADPQVRLVTLTVTEKGYCLSADGVDMAHADIAHDLAAPDRPRSAIGYIVAGLRARHAAGERPYTVLSCDNLADNGNRLRRATLQYAERVDAELASWIADQVTFPCSMVDSITPATDDALRESVDEVLGLHDAWPVQRERYTQWVLEDRFCNGRPDWERAGVTLSDDIAGYDRAKLRLLNAAHSALAYLGLLQGLRTVGQAMADPALGPFVAALMRDIAASTALPPGLDPETYIDAILQRFSNPAVSHQLIQIAQDGSQKIPVRLFGTIADALAAGRCIDALCMPVAAWLHFIRQQARAGVALADPLDGQLRAIGAASTGDGRHDVPAFLALPTVFGALATEARFTAALERAYDAVRHRGAS